MDPTQLPFQTMGIPDAPSYIAPDGSEIRLLPEMNGGGLAHCRLPLGRISKAVKHRTVEEIWFVLEGKGRIWLKQEGDGEVVELHWGISVTIPVGTKFQFRNDGDGPLNILIVTMPPWPKPEAMPVEGVW